MAYNRKPVALEAQGGAENLKNAIISTNTVPHPLWPGDCPFPHWQKGEG